MGIAGLLAAFVLVAADWHLESPLFNGIIQFDTYARSFSLVMMAFVFFVY